jgi:hypothetical protein
MNPVAGVVAFGFSPAVIAAVVLATDTVVVAVLFAYVVAVVAIALTTVRNSESPQLTFDEFTGDER